MKREELQKKRQELYSWNWFYQNNLENLAVSRYYKVNKTIINKETNESEVIKVFPNIYDDYNGHYGNSIYYSKRFKDERQASEKCMKDIRLNQIELDKFYNK